MNQLMLRRATPADAKLYFNWVNDPDVRKNALNQDFIGWDSHLEWFKNRLKVGSIMFVLTSNEESVGQIRFDSRDKNIYYLDYSIDRNNRGKGFGKRIIEMSLECLRHRSISGVVVAHAKIDNIASNKVFNRLSFDLVGKEVIDNQLVNRYEFSI